ncbi:MAG TPA: NADP-dependent oxidoreductase [Cyclobacteriaceae bacterium]|nr:NADP-dependent oxidoreductase [Cyclobacteriaceae bacterium]
MKAIQYTAFGNSSVLKLNEISKPIPKDDEVLIKLKATTVNPFDMKVRGGLMQKMLNTQLPYTPGSDVVGVIEAVGGKATRLHVGDQVFGTTFGGTYAEYAVVKEVNLTTVPNNVTPEEAVSLAVPIVTSYTLLEETAKVQAGQRILIHGAAGSVGSVMLQMAKAMSAYVIGTSSGKEIERLKSYGADQVIDYKSQDFSKLVNGVDLVADLVGGETQTKSFSVLKKGGKLISIVMPPDQELAKKFEVTAQFMNSTPSYKKLEFGRQLIEQGKMKAHIIKVMKLEQAAEAQDLVSGGGVSGKVVLMIK